MHKPPHPGEVLREYLGDTTVTAAALCLGVHRATLNRILSGASGISADMAYRLACAFGTSPEFWAGIQKQHDLYQAGKLKRPKIERLNDSSVSAQNQSVKDLKGMFPAAKGQRVSIADMRPRLSASTLGTTNTRSKGNQRGTT